MFPGCFLLLLVRDYKRKRQKRGQKLTDKLENSQNLSKKQAKKGILDEGWPVYKDFELEETGGDVWLYAVSETPHRVYAPLRDTGDLFREFASLGRKGGISKEEAVESMRGWVTTYGTLGTDDGGAREQSLGSFSREVSIAARRWELYQAATAEIGRHGDPDVEALDGYNIAGDTPTQKREKALEDVAEHVGWQVKHHCFPRLYRNVHRKTGRTVDFEEGWGFDTLLSAMYLQMMWFMTGGGDAPRCKFDKCGEIIRMGVRPPGADSGEDYEQRGIGRPARYNTRTDKEFCSRNCKQKWRYHNIIKPRRQAQAGQ